METITETISLPSLPPSATTDIGEESGERIYIWSRFSDQRAALRWVRRNLNWQGRSCSHTHDCCGCYRLMPARVSRTRTLLIVTQSYYQNI